MGQVQEQLHVEHRIPPPPNKVHRIPNRHDLLRGERESRHRRLIRYLGPRTPLQKEAPHLTRFFLSVDYIDQQSYVSVKQPTASIYNNDFVGVASYNIFVGIYVATIFGSAFFFDLFWPDRAESPAVKLAWRICSMLAILFTLSSAIAYTVILATRAAYFINVDAATGNRLVKEFGGNNRLVYRENPRAVASVVFLWVGMCATVASTVLLWRSLEYIDANGPKSKVGRERDSAVKEKMVGEDGPAVAVAAPAAVHHGRGDVERGYEGV